MQKHVGAETTWTAILIATLCGTGTLAILVKWFSQQKVKRKISTARKRRAATLQQAEQAVHQYKNLHPGTDTSLILSLSLPELTTHLKEGSLRPEDVFYCYMEKTLEVDKRVNCCTEIMVESFDQLKTVDSRKDGTLYGVPVSIKENIGCKGYDTSCGAISNLDKPALMDSVIVEVLKRQGAIPFVKTNLPQGLTRYSVSASAAGIHHHKSYDCSNPIYGQTLNPHNLQKASGGSTGGEGALIGAGGSVLGIGTDIGGSIRIPSAFCGICGFKPTAGRLSARGIKTLSRGQKSVLSSAGPLAKDVGSLSLCMQALLSNHMFCLDPTIPPIPFNLEVYQSSKPLRIGYYENDGYLEPSPSMARAFREVKALLEKAGHTFVCYSPPRLSYAMHELITRGMLADGAITFLSGMREGPVDPAITMQIFTYSLPILVKRLISNLLKPLFPRMAEIVDAVCGVGSIQALWKQHADVEDYIYESIAEWRRCEMDVLLCPMLGPAFSLSYCSKLNSPAALSYTILYNLLNFPAGVVPVSTVTAKDEEELKHYKGNFQDPLDKLFKKAVAGGEGLPVAVQCVALPWQDELCLRFMKEVEQLVKQCKISEN